MASKEVPVLFECDGAELAGILHQPEKPSAIGVMIVVGGPQYRVGSHRQFVLIARVMARHGIPVFRFDHRGVGDSNGHRHDFDELDLDISAAFSAFSDRCQFLRGFVTLGLCDAATACALVAERSGLPIVGQIALNPWVRTAAGEDEAVFKHYYVRRVLSRDFWSSILRGEYALRLSIEDLVSRVRRTIRRHVRESVKTPDDLPALVRNAQINFSGKTLIVLSERDLVAKEYLARVKESQPWSRWFESESVTVKYLDKADHTFSSADLRNRVSDWCIQWILDLEKRPGLNEDL